MDSATITTASFTLMQGSSFVSGTVSYIGTTAIFAPSSFLAPNTLYIATITTMAKSVAGRGLANNFTWSFTTGAAAAVIPPTVSLTDPLNGATGVPINQKIAATFSVAMDASTITIATFTLKQGSTSVSGIVSFSGTTAFFSPVSNFAPNAPYTATITTGAKDLTGNALVNNYEWSFTTGTAVVVTPPTVTSTDPANLAIGVALNQKVAATFSKTMDASTITTATFTLKQGTTSVSGIVSYSGTTAIFSPVSNLLPNTLYTATITTGAMDLTGNTLATNYVWSFTTGAAVIITPPIVSLTDPLNAAIGVALNQKVVATFSKTMDASTITTATFTLKQGTISVSGFVSYMGTTATFSPVMNLIPNTEYTATITTGAKDLAGNSLAANYVWSFKTIISYSVTLSSNPMAGGTTSGSGTFNSGSAITVTATANAGYKFTNWTENGIQVSTNANYQFTVIGNRILVANYLVGPGGLPVYLGSASNFAILAGSGVSST
ncbi:MAG: Ig-like domain-containing protein, partial [Methylotenera sp.]|nr:Ig-like domain-containing protein [Methylotenera sp.]